MSAPLPRSARPPVPPFLPPAVRRSIRPFARAALAASLLASGLAPLGALGAQVAPGTRLNLVDARLADAIRSLAAALGLNVVLADVPDRRVSFTSATPLGAREVGAVLESILEANALVLVQQGGIARVLPADRAPASGPVGVGMTLADPPPLGLVTQLVPLQAIRADEGAATLRQIASPTARIESVTRSNALLITDRGANVARYLELLSQSRHADTGRVRAAHVRRAAEVRGRRGSRGDAGRAVRGRGRRHARRIARGPRPRTRARHVPAARARSVPSAPAVDAQRRHRERGAADLAAGRERAARRAARDDPRRARRQRRHAGRLARRADDHRRERGRPTRSSSARSRRTSRCCARRSRHSTRGPCRCCSRSRSPRSSLGRGAEFGIDWAAASRGTAGTVTANGATTPGRGRAGPAWDGRAVRQPRRGHAARVDPGLIVRRLLRFDGLDVRALLRAVATRNQVKVSRRRRSSR